MESGTEGNRLSTLNGCFIPCLLTILGAVLFLRLGFAVGMMGLVPAMGMLIVSEIMSSITVTSFSAMASNGEMRGGGAYYILSRNLGPAFGGAGGLLFWISYSLNATFNVVAVTDVLQSFIDDGSWWSGKWAGVAISSTLMVPLGLIAYKGAGFFASLNHVVFVGLTVSCIVTALCLFFSQEEIQLEGGPDRTFMPFSLETLVENMWAQPAASPQCASSAGFGMQIVNGEVCTPRLIFSVIFPAVVGMMEGLNLSGDLKRPARSIPLGTFWAIGVAFIVYATLMIGQAGTLSRPALQFNMDVLQESTVHNGSFVVLGVVTACLSTVLGSLFGAARVLQAMARDDVFPGISCFRHGTAKGDEPRPALVASYLLAQAALLLGNLDDIAPLLTNFFLLTYALTDMACFLLEISGVPNFRPTFRAYSWQTSLANSILTLVVMFYLSPLYAATTIGVVFVILTWLTHRFRDRMEWIDISQALFFGWARDSLYAIQQKPPDTKYWRPSLLLLLPASASASTAGFMQLVIFLNRLKQSGLFIIGRALIAEQPPACSPSDHLGMMAQMQSTSSGASDFVPLDIIQPLAAAVPDFRGFQQWAVAPTGRMASYNLVLGAGLGRLLPDTVVLPLPWLPGPGCAAGEGSPGPEQAGLQPPVPDPHEFMQVLRDVLSLRRDVLVAANFSNISPLQALASPQRSTLDLWVFGELHEPPLPAGLAPKTSVLPMASDEMVNQMSLLLQLGHLASMQSDATLRLLHVKHDTPPRNAEAAPAVDAEGPTAMLRRWLQWSRMPRATAEAALLQAPPPGNPGHQPPQSLPADWPDAGSLNQFVGHLSSKAEVILSNLPPLPSTMDGSVDLPYLQSLCELTSGLPPMLLALSGQGFPVISTDI